MSLLMKCLHIHYLLCWWIYIYFHEYWEEMYNLHLQPMNSWPLWQRTRLGFKINESVERKTFIESEWGWTPELTSILKMGHTGLLMSSPSHASITSNTSLLSGAFCSHPLEFIQQPHGLVITHVPQWWRVVPCCLLLIIFSSFLIKGLKYSLDCLCWICSHLFQVNCSSHC